MQYNPNNGSPLFACYSSASQQAIAIYSLTATSGGEGGGETPEPDDPVVPAGTVKGHVDSFELANGLVQTIMVKDEKGDIVRVFIDGYITTAEDVKDLAVGNEITVTGVASYDNTFNAPEGPFPRIRIRDRADIVCGAVDPDYEAPATGDTFQPMLWLSLMALTTAAGAVMLLRRKEQQ